MKMKILAPHFSLTSGSRQLPCIQPRLHHHHYSHDQTGARQHLLIASGGARPTLTSSRLLLLPATLSHAHGSRRLFSNEAAAALDTAVNTLQHLYTGLHHTAGTPWFVTIPLIALALNFAARLPVSLYLHSIARRRAAVTPLLRAWYVRHARRVTAQSQTQSPGQRLPPSQERRRIAAAVRRSTAEMYRTWGCQAWKNFAPVAVLPVWLLGIETVRRMCGAPRGMLGSAVFGRQQPQTVGAPASAGAAPADSALPSIVDSVAAGSGGGVDASAAISAVPIDPTLGVDASLITGGCLWFPDLTAADPLHILPVALSVVLALNMVPKSPKGASPLYGIRELFNLSPDAKQDSAVGASAANLSGPGMRILNRTLFVTALAIGPITMDLPAALHLYWLSSATITLVQSAVFQRLMPIERSSIQPCQGSESTLTRPRRGS